jgi:predicted PurR-regulated permease PerM
VAIGTSLNRLQPGSDLPTAGTVSPLTKLLIVVIVIGALYFGRDIFVPLALAMLLSFALAPLVRRLRKLYFPNVPAVLTVVVFAFLVIVSFGWIVAVQIGDLAESLPTYRTNIEAKIDSLREAPPGGRLFERASDMLRDLGRKIIRAARTARRRARTRPPAMKSRRYPSRYTSRR